MQLASQRQNHDQGQLEFLDSVHVKLSRLPPRNIPENPFCSLLQVRNSNVRRKPLAHNHLGDAITPLVIL